MGNHKHRKFNGDEVFFTSDLHLYHKALIKAMDRNFDSVEEMNEALINNWNSVVGPNDHVFHLGDICLASKTKVIETLSKLNGKIHLIWGNHDTFNRLPNYLTQLPVEDGDFMETIIVDGQEIVLSHYPFQTWSGIERGVWNIHGHLHSTPRTFPKNKILNSYDAGVDNNKLTPVSYEEMKTKIRFSNIKIKWQKYLDKKTPEEIMKDIKNSIC